MRSKIYFFQVILGGGGHPRCDLGQQNTKDADKRRIETRFSVGLFAPSAKVKQPAGKAGACFPGLTYCNAVHFVIGKCTVPVCWNACWS